MERRNLHKNSVLGAGPLISGLRPASGNGGGADGPEAYEMGDGSSGGLVEGLGTSYEVTDTLTKVPVTVTRGRFLIAPKQLTQREFEAVMGYNPSLHKG